MTTKSPKNDDRLDLRDLELRQRVDEFIARLAKAGKKLTRSEILRAATTDFLNRIDREGKIVIELPPELPKKK